MARISPLEYCCSGLSHLACTQNKYTHDHTAMLWGRLQQCQLLRDADEGRRYLHHRNGSTLHGSLTCSCRGGDHRRGSCSWAESSLGLGFSSSRVGVLWRIHCGLWGRRGPTQALHYAVPHNTHCICMPQIAATCMPPPDDSSGLQPRLWRHLALGWRIVTDEHAGLVRPSLPAPRCGRGAPAVRARMSSRAAISASRTSRMCGHCPLPRPLSVPPSPRPEWSLACCHSARLALLRAPLSLPFLLVAQRLSQRRAR